MSVELVSLNFKQILSWSSSLPNDVMQYEFHTLDIHNTHEYGIQASGTPDNKLNQGR